MRTLAADVFNDPPRQVVALCSSWTAPLVLIAGAVSGCAGVGDETFGDALTADPGKYTLYNCRDVDCFHKLFSHLEEKNSKGDALPSVILSSPK